VARMTGHMPHEITPAIVARATSSKIASYHKCPLLRPMTFRDWQELPPEKAAREIHTRVRTLPKNQQRAVIAELATKDELIARFKASPRGTPLGGVPFFAKDIFDFAGSPTRAGSTFLDTVRPVPERDGAFANTLRAAGAVYVGKTHLHEFAYGVTGENPHYGDVEHPRFAGHTTGGSSSGSAAVVAADIVPFALGTDTGGSVRVPAAFCGLYGFRLTPRDPFIRDAFPLAPTFDTAGWFTASAADMRATLGTLVNLRLGVDAPNGCYLEMPGLGRDVAAACRTAAIRGGPVMENPLRYEILQGFSTALDAYHTIVAVEAWQAHRTWAEKYETKYDPAVWQRLNRVHNVTREQIESAEHVLKQVRGIWDRLFDKYDYVMLAASPCAAPTKAECTQEMRNRILALTAPASVGGLPVLTVPVPLPSGMTTGLQIVAKETGSPVFAWALDQYVV
jgi:aspartyl-tRNA(Asn)/glutamyl-tRNA(Gln) amidotransferase subunit A